MRAVCNEYPVPSDVWGLVLKGDFGYPYLTVSEPLSQRGFMPRKISEERNSKELIDPPLERTDWYLHDSSKVEIENPVPPLSLQEEFASVVATEGSVEQMRSRQAESGR